MVKIPVEQYLAGLPQTKAKAHWSGALAALVTALATWWFTDIPPDQEVIQSAIEVLVPAALVGITAWISAYRASNKVIVPPGDPTRRETPQPPPTRWAA